MGQSFSLGALFPLTWRLWLGRRLFGQLDFKVVRVSWNRIIKGPCDPCELEAMQYVASNTTIPVPKVFGVHLHHNGGIYIEMAYIQGETLDAAWHNGLPRAQKDTIAADLKEHNSSLRQLNPPSRDIVCSAAQNPLHDCRVGSRFFGPMNQDEFHSMLRMDVPMEHVEPALGQEVAATHTRRYRSVFTHADLAPRNIIVRKGRVVAIIDWAFAGWYPEYWEFTKAHYNYFDDDWETYLGLLLPCYEKELIAERHLWKLLPDPGSRWTNEYPDGTTQHNEGSEPSAAWLEKRKLGHTQDLWSLALATMS